MPYLRSVNTVPPGGWRYFQPETQLWFNGDDQGLQDMIKRIAEHRVFRLLDRQGLREVEQDVHNQLCERLGPIHCQSAEGESFFHIKQDFSANITGEVALAGSKALIAFIGSGLQVVDKAQAQSRADICRQCHLNTPMKGCGSCSTLNHTIEKLLKADRRIPGLEICAACGCGLKLKVNTPLEVIDKADEGRAISYPSWCFVTKEREHARN